MGSNEDEMALVAKGEAFPASEWSTITKGLSERSNPNASREKAQVVKMDLMNPLHYALFFWALFIILCVVALYATRAIYQWYKRKKWREELGFDPDRHYLMK